MHHAWLGRIGGSHTINKQFESARPVVGRSTERMSVPETQLSLQTTLLVSGGGVPLEQTLTGHRIWSLPVPEAHLSRYQPSVVFRTPCLTPDWGRLSASFCTFERRRCSFIFLIK